MTFDSKHTWTTHINELSTECKKRLNIIKALWCANWGADQESLIRVYRALIRSKIDYGSIFYGSANPRTLKKLETIQNTALQLCLEPFKTTPVTSILAESQEKPLELRRMELSIIYATDALSSSLNPMYSKLSNNINISPYQTHPRLHKPLKIRLGEYLQSTGIKLITIYQRGAHSLPPWNNTDIPINLDLAQYHKPTTSDRTYRQLFMECKNTCAEYHFLHTDGSIIEGKAGCVVVSECENLKSIKLPSECSIYSCELYALSQALEIIKEGLIPTQYVICSDSLSSLTALKNRFSKNPLIQLIQSLVSKLLTRGTNIVMLWIPLHQRIPGNERADALAKNAAKNASFQESIPVQLFEAKKYTRETVRDHWNQK